MVRLQVEASTCSNAVENGWRVLDSSINRNATIVIISNCWSKSTNAYRSTLLIDCNNNFLIVFDPTASALHYIEQKKFRVILIFQYDKNKRDLW